MKKLILALSLFLSSPALAQNYQATQGSGTTFGTKLVSAVNYPQFVVCDPTTPAQCAAVDASGRLSLIPNTAINIAQINGVTPLMGNGATGTGSHRVTISNDNTIPTGWPTAANQTSQITQETAINTVLGTQADSVCGTATGTCTLQALIKFLNTAATSSIPAGTALIGDVNVRQGGTALSTTNGIYSNLLQGNAVLSATNGTFANVLQGNAVLSITNPIFNRSVATATGGASTTGNIGANNTTAVVVKASAGTLYGAQIYGIGSAPAYLKIYNATSATCGSGTPVKRLMIPAASTAANGAGSNISFGETGVDFSTGITYCLTTGIADNDTTAPAASTFLVNLDWK